VKKRSFIVKMTQLLVSIGVLLLAVSAVHSVAMEYLADNIPGKTPSGINYKKPKTVKSPKLSNKNGLRFAMFGDWGMKTSVKDRVADGVYIMQKALQRKRMGFKAILLSGDNFYSKGVKGLDDPKWEDLWGRSFRRVGVPFYVSLGNHDYGYGAKNAQFQVQKSGTKGFELWQLRDENGADNPGIYFTQWFYSRDFACQVNFIDTSILVLGDVRDKKAWGKQLHWLSKKLDEKPPKSKSEQSVVRLVIGHHLLQCFGEKESEVKYMSSDRNRLGPNNTHLKDIVIKKADAYLCGHAHTVEYVNLAGKDVSPKKGPIHGKVRSLDKQAPLELCSGSAAQVRQKSYWDKSCYYVARIPGFTLIALEKKKGKVFLHSHFVDCRKNKMPKIIYTLSMPLDKK
jgi:hypothetical protein